MTGPARAASVTYQRARVRKAMLHFTTHSTATRDMRGVEPSLYRGRFFKASKESIRRCIVKRESEGQYDVRGGGGNRYFGAYQMSDALADGATHMMLKEHKKILGEKTARSLMKQLRQMPPNAWPRYWQDAAFSTVYNWKSQHAGFQDELEATQSQLFEEGVRQLRSLVAEAAASLRSVLVSPSSADRDKISAARTVLQFTDLNSPVELLTKSRAGGPDEYLKRLGLE